jgi:hypothetical protein
VPHAIVSELPPPEFELAGNILKIQPERDMKTPCMVPVKNGVISSNFQALNAEIETSASGFSGGNR